MFGSYNVNSFIIKDGKSLGISEENEMQKAGNSCSGMLKSRALKT